MPSKTVLYTLVGILLVLFVLLMVSGTILKKPFGKDDDFNYHVNQTHTAITNNQWEQAENSIKKTEAAWKIVRKRVLFSADQNDIRQIDETIAMLRSNIAARERGLALENIAVLKVTWESIH